MGLQGFERRLERLVEGTFGKAFRSGLQPVEIGRRLVRELDAGRTLGVRGTVVPEPLRRVALAEDDLERFAGFADALVQRARRRGARARPRARATTSSGPVDVTLVADDTRASAATSTSSPRSSKARRRPTGALVLPDGRRVALGEEPARHRPHPRLRGRRSPTRRSRATTPRSGRADHGFVVVDLGSMNGTQVNGVAVQRARCSPTAT